MNKRNIYQRKMRQLKFVSKQLQQNFLQSGAAMSSELVKLRLKAKKLILELKQVLSVFELKRVLGSAALLFGISSTNQVSAQNFLAPVANPFNTTAVNTIASPAMADLDNDGDLDLLVGEKTGSMEYFKNIGTTTAPSYSAAVMNPFGLSSTASWSFPTFVDLDNDGDKDIMVGDGAGNLNYFQNTGSATVPSFTTAPVQNPFGLTATSYVAGPSFADLDGDGDKDLIVGEYGGNMQYFQNTGTAAAPAFAAAAANPYGLVATTGYAQPAFCDLDSDGDQDLMVGDATGSLSYFQNTLITSVKSVEFSNPFLLKVYPNPTTEYIQISCAWFANIQKIEIIDVTGKVCSTHTNASEFISVKDLASGIYTVKIVNKEGNYEVRKIQKI